MPSIQTIIAKLPEHIALNHLLIASLGVILLLVILWLLARQRNKQQLLSAELALQNQVQSHSELQVAFAEQKQELQSFQQRLSTAQQELAAARAAFDSEQKNAAEKIQLLQQAREQLNTQFENTAQAIFEQKNKQFKQSSQEQIGQLLNPLAEQLKGFQQTVSLKFETEGKERASLQGEINKLLELNRQIDEDAKALTQALSGKNKVQGNWGEMVLQKVLESSGLREGHEYKQQVSSRNNNGKLIQPDVVVYLPDERVVVIDSKVSLSAYQHYAACENSDERKRHLKAHVQSIRQHVDGLSSKDYHTAFEQQSLDYVFMFLPVEAAYIDAIQADPNLLEYAMKQNIGIISPSSLLTNLRTVANLWRYEQQNKNALKIAETAGKLYDKLAASLDAFKDVEQRLEQASQSWQTAWNRLSSGRGNVLRTADQLLELGVKTKKQIKHQQDDDSPPALPESKPKPSA